ncbi:hypothetical protein AGABI1DRAFT_134058 [Agaricus bisporus var. burnettii JB137-S8]|uniref:Uncharacterized protein n=1 Tax=Agaricus bisporus var. burnettii (strain JB137-S8 / ATCC MYA-4627 / FGSC 10392) TaxID=597362 RepID=K5VHI6_AGABU|nr:uncharacterized protein AGABI1DRAFT_134058 [Agaricus bisporus var. burnettii JB137-S8]EKM73804.1 hypothetical protein AGABI1DRAFT_134058 [Agaricus bisporus var. burnettii JB137-S8]
MTSIGFMLITIVLPSSITKGSAIALPFVMLRLVWCGDGTIGIPRKYDSNEHKIIRNG